ncbi:Ig-like domain-containing protein [Streptomyces sp. DSM 44917]|uniref:Ig-like domain-containing protein n=1 Tax=Streptomyces boetiae TaxID=3075541 RepID=A0ABU2LE40_9ACTN|nr:Ig-like domain-containing protein [Streptomyces sp. DSM 44917]MDT0309834.1 Ig-like domain-containing protein [Streptomyces sp. DSM 44917]
MSHTTRVRLGSALILAPLLAGLSACGESDQPLAGDPYDATGQLSFGTAQAPEGKEAATAVDPDSPLKISATGGGTRITDVAATDAGGRPLAGELTADGRGWRSTSPLAAGITYTVRVATENGEGAPGRGTHSFTTRAVDGEKQLNVTFGPEAGTYGVGQPVTAKLSRKISDPRQRALVEGALAVESQPATQGSWHWVDDTELHYRPEDYWPANASITVRSHLAGLPIREGLRGGTGKPLDLRTGDRVEAIADISAHTMTVLRNGEELRTLPITTGKEGFATRSGKKVILGREQFVRMTGTSIGIPAGSAESYDLPVYWAARLTWSGEYVHGAPWSVGSQGSANVSHGCTGLSTENAQWFYELVRPGDIVEHVNGFGEDMAPFGNGFGDWNLSWEEWREGSALHGEDAATATPARATGRLQPQV